MEAQFDFKTSREEMRLSQGDLAELFSVSVSYISNLERGFAKIPVQWIPKVALLFGIEESKVLQKMAEDFVDHAQGKMIPLTAKERKGVEYFVILSEQRRKSK